ncbi:MAG: VOC family protein [Chloroflexota bacterium]
MFLGLRTITYPAPGLEAQKSRVRQVLGIEPYFDQPFYVNFNVGGYELALDSDADIAKGPITYWGVSNADDSLRLLLLAGAELDSGVETVGEDIRVATVLSPGSKTVLGIIENPHFQLAGVVAGEGPGR